MRIGRLLLALTVGLVGVSAGVGAPGSQHRIRSGDTLRIVVLNRPEYGQEVVVQDDGRINYFLLGAIDVESLTLEDLRKRLAEGLTGHLTDPDVLIVRIPRERDVYVGGQVGAPGRYGFMDPHIDLRKALALAGDALPDSADMTRVHLVRDGVLVETYDLTTPPGPHIQAYRGDVVYVSERTRIRVSGNVREPGAFHVASPVSAGYALSLAGGIVDDQGSLGRLMILRARGSTETIELSDDLAGADGTAHEVRHGDTLYVPNAYVVEEVSVLGYVQKPGLYRVRGPVTAGRALALAGDAVREDANLDVIEIVRLDGSVESVDLRRDASTALVHPGETVRVNAKFKVNWPLVFSAVSTAVLLTSLVRQ